MSGSYRPYHFYRNMSTVNEDCACGTSPADYELSLPAVQIKVCRDCANELFRDAERILTQDQVV